MKDFDWAADSEKGMALVLVLMILVIITAMVTEFSYGVYTSTAALNNWRESQRLSFISRSGLSLAVKTLADAQRLVEYTYPGKIEMPVENIFEGFSGSVVVTVEDEASRFNLNSLTSDAALSQFRVLLEKLNIDVSIADRIADWIDANSDPRLRDSEEGAKNDYLDSTDELLSIKGIDRETFEKLLPYVTAYGALGRVSININTAALPVIMSLGVSKDDAERIVREREKRPFTDRPDNNLSSRVGSTIATPLGGNYVTKSSYFRITSAAEDKGIRRTVQCVVQVDGSGRATVKYWREL